MASRRQFVFRPPRFRRLVACGLFALVSFAPSLRAQSHDRVVLGRLATGATVTFVNDAGSGWGIEIEGGPSPHLRQMQPARIEVFRAKDDIRDLAAAYGKIQRSAAGVDADAVIADGDRVSFRVNDRWSLDGAVVSVHRTVEITGHAPGGFGSSVVFAVDPSVRWRDVKCFAPGALYGDPSHDGARSPGGTLNYAARYLVMREDILPAPLFALQFRDGASVAVLDPTPQGESTFAETKLVKTVMIDRRFQFGALGAWQAAGGPVEFGFRFPGTAKLYTGGGNAKSPAQWFRRYHPIAPGVPHRYTVSFRFGATGSFPDLTRAAWRWAWLTLNPVVAPIDIAEVRRVLLDHLEAHAATIDGRTGIPFVLNTITDKLQWNWTMIAMGFVGKDLECARELLWEGDRDHAARGQKMHRTGVAIIASMIKALPNVPPEATGFNLATGKPWHHIWLAPWLRNACEGRLAVLQAYLRERAHGRLHPDWYRWVKDYVDWLVRQQRADGSFPRRWKAGSDEVAEPTGTTSYAPVPLLDLMTKVTGDPQYERAAVRAGDYVWTHWGVRGLFAGGASDNPNITDKEAGMLSLEAFLSLYDATGNPEWLQRAQVAGTFAESWIWIWNLPMPVDATNAELNWKQGVPTIGLQGITARVAGSVDEYLDWAVPLYAKLYDDTKDPHYLDVAYVLLHGTKSMLALPGRTYDMKGIGWQQEHWRLGPGPDGRGVGSHRLWLPWVSANHLAGIIGLEDNDPALFKRLCAGPMPGGTETSR